MDMIVADHRNGRRVLTDPDPLLTAKNWQHAIGKEGGNQWPLWSFARARLAIYAAEFAAAGGTATSSFTGWR